MLKLDWLEWNKDSSKFKPIAATDSTPHTVDESNDDLHNILNRVDQEIEEMESDTDEKQVGEESPEDAPEVDEVAEPTSKTSEDVHGGDEASGDIEDSPNAMDDGVDDANAIESGGDASDEDKADSNSNSNSNSDSDSDSEATEEMNGSQQDESKHCLADLGGEAINESRARKIVRDWIMKLATEGLVGHEHGHSFWDKKKIVKDLLIGREWRIPRDRYSKEPDGLMIMLDFSGSCSWISRTFASLGKAAAAIPTVIVAWGGWEGYVQGFIKPDTDIDNIRTYYSDDSSNELPLSDYLKQHPNVRTVVILGDYDGVPCYVDAYKAHRKVKFIWLHPNPEEELYNKEYKPYVEKMIRFFDGTVKGLATVVKKI